MITTQNFPPTYRPPANHLLRMIYPGLSRLRCIRTCEGEVTSGPEKVVEIQQKGIRIAPYGSMKIVIDKLEGSHVIDGSTPICYFVVGQFLTPSPHTRLSIYKPPGAFAGNLVYGTLVNDIDADEIFFDYNSAIQDPIPGVDRFMGTVTGIRAFSPSVEWTATINVLTADITGFPVAPTTLTEPNELVKTTTVNNTGTAQLIISEDGAPIAFIQPGQTVVLPMAGKLGLSANAVIEGVDSTHYREGSVIVTQRQRCLCGDTIIVPVPEPIGGDLV